jgi:hypothetical protein
MFVITNADLIQGELEVKNKKVMIKFLKTLKPNGIFFNIKQGFLSKAGIPDIIGCYYGRFVAFEVKSNQGGVTKLQAVILKWIAAAGGICGIVRSLADVKVLLNRIPEITYDLNQPCWMQDILWGVKQGHRNHYATKLAEYYLEFFSGNADETWTALSEWNKRNEPPLEKYELQAILDSIKQDIPETEF